MSNIEARLTLIGGPTVLLEINGLRLITDPTFDPPANYDLGAVILVKELGPTIAPNDLGKLDAVLLSHDQHADNLDRLGRQVLDQVGLTFTTIVGASRLGAGAVGLAPWETRIIEGLDGTRLFVTGTPARHGPPGVETITGEVTGFLLGVDEPGDAVYISGDTVWYEGVAEVARRYRPRLLVLNVGSAQPRGAFHVTMDANDAIETANAFPQAQVIGVHNEGWRHFKEGPDALAQAFGALGLAERYVPLVPGQAKALSLPSDGQKE